MDSPSYDPAPAGDALLTRRQVLARIGMGRTWLHDVVLARRFPQPVRIGPRVLWVRRRHPLELPAQPTRSPLRVPSGACRDPLPHAGLMAEAVR
jgi:predicted DNA-binding transcriptional regulator AlpA